MYTKMARTSFIILLVSLYICATQAFLTPHAKTLVSPVDLNRGVSPPTSSHSWSSSTTTSLSMAADQEENKLPFWLDPNTKGGVIVLSIVLFLIPFLGYNIATGIFGFDGIEAGKWIGVGFTAVGTVLWVGSYIFRVATKDMTYAKQLKDYENAVIAKRLEELDDDEIQALVEEIEREDF